VHGNVVFLFVINNRKSTRILNADISQYVMNTFSFFRFWVDS